MFYTLGASLCTGIAVSCFLILFFDLASMIELEKHEEMADTKKLPFFIRMFLPLASALKRVSSSELFAEMRKKTAEMLESNCHGDGISADIYFNYYVSPTITHVEKDKDIAEIGAKGNEFSFFN